MTVTAADFWLAKTVPDPWAPDPWATTTVEELDTERVTALISAPQRGVSDLDTAVALMDLARDDLHLSGTSGEQRISDTDLRLVVRALTRTTARAGWDFRLPFRDHTEWKSFWIRRGASGAGGWQARRELLSELFDQTYAELVAAQDRALGSNLLDAVSPHERLGWPEIDDELDGLRRRFRSAQSVQDYRAVGNDCVHITEALSRKVYDHDVHTPEGEQEPPVARTKLRLDRYVDARLSGPQNAEMRKFARALIELSQAVKHRGAPTRVEAGIVADAVIALSNMLRRLNEDA